MNVEIISVGTELVIGDIVNTNATYLARALANLGMNVYKHTSVGDNAQRLIQAFEAAYTVSDMVIVTGGLGPTPDDLTKECAAAYFKCDLCFDAHTWDRIVAYFERKGNIQRMTENNRKQAFIPQGAVVIDNTEGTAPGLIIESKTGKRMILLPGPPKEMKTMFQSAILPYLTQLSDQVFRSKYVRCYGVGESWLATQLASLIDNQTNPTLALYAKPGEIMLRITARAVDEQTANMMIEQMLTMIKATVGTYIYLIGDEMIADSPSELPHVVGQALINQGLTIATAESLTGGDLAARLVDQAGISSVFQTGIVAYSNQAKINLLGVAATTLATYGAVSEQVAYEMVSGLAKLSQADIAIATTGIAGPTSDDSLKPVGLAYIALYYRGEVIVKAHHFCGDRSAIRQQCVMAALNEVRHILISTSACNYMAEQSELCD